MTRWMNGLARCSLPLALAAAVTATGCGTGTADDGVDASASRSKPRPEPSPSPSPTPTPTPTPTPAPTPSGGGAIAWQVQLDGPYSSVRPALGPDGTVYAVDVHANLYAVSPDGTLRWKVPSAGGKGVAVDGDGTVFVGSEGAVRAYGPDGVLRWTFVQNPRAFVLQGIAVGPDGNLYGVATQGIGVFSLTPQGALRWATPEVYSRPFVGYSEIVFGPGPKGPQLYFYANNHTRAVRLDGTPAWSVVYGGQPAVSPVDGSVHVGDVALRASDGSVQWQLGLSSGATVAVDARGTSYFTFLQSAVYAVDASGKQLWTRTASDWLRTPTVDPAGTKVVFTGSDPATNAGVLDAYSTSGALLWRLALPSIGGATQWVDTPLRFTADGATAYLVTAQSTSVSPAHAFLTAIRP